MSLIKQSSYAAVAAIILSASRFALAAIVARRATTSDFGTFVYTQWLIDISFLVCSFGAAGVASRYIAQHRKELNLLQEFLYHWPKLLVSLPVLVGVAVNVGALISGLDFEVGLALPLAVWGAVSAVWLLQTAALTGLQRFDLILLANVVAGFIMVVGAYLVPQGGDALRGLLWVMAVASGCASFVGVYQVIGFRSKLLGQVKAQYGLNWAEIRRYALNMWLISLLWSLVWSRGELPVVKYYLGQEGVASYSTVQSLFGGAMQGVMLGLSAVASQLTGLWGDNKRSEALLLAKKIMNVQLLVCGCAALILVYLGPELLGYVFGEKYIEQSVSLSVISLGLVSMVVANQNHILQIETNGSFTRNSAMLGVVLLFAAAPLLIYNFGVVGASSSRVLVMSVLCLISIFFFAKNFGAENIEIINFIAVWLIGVLSVVVVYFGNIQSLYLRIFFLMIAVGLLFLLIRRGDILLKIKKIFPTKFASTK